MIEALGVRGARWSGRIGDEVSRHVTWSEALRVGAVEVEGPAPLCRALPGRFALSVFAAVPQTSTAAPHP
ncbi:hypothetical protein ACF1HJ_41770 [Streptomyces sp. NPDC013978]|uniref:hypothetical protein n=1 Tax=Streptomyces sp. NPDC013978 TaxID=3364869 RepID=UPI003700721F